MAGRIRSRRPLFVAMFLHDIAKGRQEDHSIAGERIARALGPRFGLTESETDAAAWLVRYHLVLSDTAQRRDIFDPKTVSDMVDIIRTRERLRMLLILTIADIKGVGPTTWNRWKAQLLEQLYLEVESVLGGTAPDASRQERAAAVREEVARLLPAHVSRGALERLDTAYWLSFPPETCVRHLRLLAIAEHRMAQGRPFAVLDPVRETRNGVTTVTVVAPDRPGLFAELLGSFSSIGVFLVGAKAFTSVNGIVLDVFEVRDAKSRTIQDPDRFRRLRARMLDRVNEQGRGSAPDPPRLAEREQVFVVPPEVIVDNDASDTATVIEVEHRHRSDLMYRVAAALRDLGLSIVSAHGTHYGELAVDVFYVKDRGGLKVTHQRRIESIETALREAVMRAV